MLTLIFRFATALLAVLSASCFAQEHAFELEEISSSLSAYVLRTSRVDQHLSIISPSRLIKGKQGVPTLQSVGPLLAREGRSSEPGERLSLLSAGFSGEDPFEPAGLLVENYRDISPLSLAVNPKTRSYRMSGILCILRNGTPKIKHIQEYETFAALCQWAVQAGPIIADANEVSTGLSLEPYTRLVACQANRSVESFDFYFFQRASLAEIDQALRGRCSIAINLTGDAQAGMTAWRGQNLIEKQGNPHSPLASMILIKAR